MSACSVSSHRFYSIKKLCRAWRMLNPSPLFGCCVLLRLLPAARKFRLLLISEQKLDRCLFLKSFSLGLAHTVMQDKCLLPSLLINCQLALGRCGGGKAEVNGFPALHFVWRVLMFASHQIAMEKWSISALYSLYPPEQ